MKKNKLLLVIPAIIFVFALAGCTIGSGKDTSKIDSGLFKSINKGETWQQKVLIPTVSGQPSNIAGIDAASLAIDPGDANAIYFGSIGSGLFYSYNGGNTWQKSAGLGNASIRSIAIDPDSKCVIYATIGNKVYKTEDCSRNWAEVYYDNEVSATIDSIAIDHFNSSVVYIGVSRGDLIKSSDNGESWQTVHRLNKVAIKKIVIDPSDSRFIYLLTARKGVFYTEDGGGNWSDFNDILKELKLGLEVKDIVLAKSEPNTIFLATTYGLLKSADKGKNWEQIELILPEKKATINAIAVNPENSEEIYYVTNTTFYRSLDGGENWSSRKLPTSRAGWKLVLDPKNPSTIYLSVRNLGK